MDANIHTPEQPTRQALAIPGRSGRLKVTGKLRKALEYMFAGDSRADAARKAGLQDHSLREALRKPHVKRYWYEGLEVLRTGERVRNLLALVEVRDKSGNAMARVQAVKALEQLEDREETRGGSSATPGFTIVIKQVSDTPTTIDVTPVEDRPSDDER